MASPTRPGTRRPYHSTIIPQRSDIPARLLAIAADEFEYAVHEIGRRVLQLYLRDLAETEVMQLLNDPTKLRNIFSEIMTNPAAGASITAEGIRLQVTRYYPSTRSRDCFALLMDAAKSQPDLSGIPLTDAVALLKAKLNHHNLTPASLRSLLQRNMDYHQLCVRNSRVRLQSDVIVQILGERHQAIKTAEVKRAVARKPQPTDAKAAKTPSRKPARRANIR